MTEYEKEIYKNFYNQKFIEKHLSNYELTLVNKIKNTSSDGPFINSDICQFILNRISDYNFNESQVEEYVNKAVFYIGRGDKKLIFDLVINKLNKKSK